MRNFNLLVPNSIRRQATRLAILTQHLHNCLPLECLPHCQVVGFVDKTVEVLTDSPAWSTRLRFHSREMLQALNKIPNLHVKQIRIKTGHFSTPAPQRTNHNEPEARKAIRSPQASTSLQQLANTTEDPKLAAALQRLARHINNSR